MSRVTFDTHTRTPPEQVLAILTDFSTRRPELWPTLARDLYEVYQVGATSADVRGEALGLRGCGSGFTTTGRCPAACAGRSGRATTSDRVVMWRLPFKRHRLRAARCAWSGTGRELVQKAGLSLGWLFSPAAPSFGERFFSEPLTEQFSRQGPKAAEARNFEHFVVKGRTTNATRIRAGQGKD